VRDKGPKKSSKPASKKLLTTVSVPGQFEPLFLKAQEYVSRYFSERTEDPEKSTISISGERYVLVRAASMSVEFFDLVTSLYKEQGEEEARTVANNLLFDIAHAIGKADAKSFHLRMGVHDPIEKLSAGPIHFSFSGWAFVEILPESAPVPDETFYIIYNHPFSFESDAWLKHGRKAKFPVCIMNAGYSSGWCEESFGLPLVSAEVECLAKGDSHCRFIMAPSTKIEEHLDRYFAQRKTKRSRTGLNEKKSISVPEFFQRKKMEEALRASHADFESRVQTRTAELSHAYDQLKEQIAERERAEKLQSSLLKITAQATSARDLEELYKGIHAIIADLMYAKNLYIALVDPITEVVNFPYFFDERDDPPTPRKGGHGLTEYVLRSGKPFLATPEGLQALVEQGEVSRTGSHSFDWMGVPLKKDDGTPFGVLVVQTYRDNARYGTAEEEILTFVSQQIARAIEHRRNQEAIRESEAKFRALAESAVPAIYIYEGEKFLYVNPASEQIFGYTREELLSMTPWQLVHPDFKLNVQQRADDRVAGKPVPSRYEFKAVNKSGDLRWLDLSASAIQFEGKSAIVATAVDITERKRAEELQSALYNIAEKASSAEDLQEFYKTIHGIVGGLMYAGNFFISFYDAPTQTLTFPYVVDSEDTFPSPSTPVPIGRGLTEYVLRTGQPLFASPTVFQELVRAGEAVSVGAESLDWLGVPLKSGGETFGVLVVQSYDERVRFTEKDKEILTFVSRQVAAAIEHKRSQQALMQSEQRYRELFENANDMILTVDLEGNVTSMNAAALQATGYNLEEALGLNVYNMVEQDQAAQLKGKLSEKLDGHKTSTTYEVEVFTKQGRLIRIEINTRLIYKNGLPSGTQGIGRDITERRALEERLRQSQKMEAVGRLAGGVAHDFNNLLTVIQGYSELMLNDLQQTHPMHEEVLEIKKAADRASSLTGQLLTFSRQQVLAPKVFDLTSVMDSMDNLLRRLLGEDIEFITKLEHGLGRMNADIGQVEQVIMNLAVNARDAMPRGGKLTIETSNALLDSGFVREHHGAIAGEFILLSVSDTGSGMDKETQSRIFEPFFTTKEQGKGTGLGLATVYGIVKQAGGYVWVNSAPGEGTRFEVYFPRVAVSAEVIDQAAARKSKYEGTETVLLVEDEDGVRALVRQVLTKHGYTVLQAASGAEALAICDQQTSPIHVLLTDVVLKHMSGRELSEILVAQRPEMKVIFMSGYTDDAVVHHGVLSQSTAFLQKPFTTQALVKMLREVLDQRAAKVSG
jgi:two-component system cell cycle sensor histidine kinase/response regulator CckA